MNRTFSIIKPDATKRNITGAINKIIEDNIIKKYKTLFRYINNLY